MYTRGEQGQAEEDVEDAWPEVGILGPETSKAHREQRNEAEIEALTERPRLCVGEQGRAAQDVAEQEDQAGEDRNRNLWPLQILVRQGVERVDGAVGYDHRRSPHDALLAAARAQAGASFRLPSASSAGSTTG